jgi:iron complex transport system substrate-binding protein
VAFRTQRLENVATALREIGRLAGTSEIAERAASDYEHRIQELRDLYRDRASLRVFIEVDDRPLYTVNGKQIISEIVELCGGRNVFADLNELAPAIGIEAVIAANPQAIISTDDTVPDAAAGWARWSHIEAVRTGNV